MSENSSKEFPRPYRGKLTPDQAAAAMQAARLNALDLLDTAEMLHQLKRFAHSAALSILAIEEACKVTILLMIFLGFGEKTNLWRGYREHRTKSQLLNPAIEARIRATFRDVPAETAKNLEEQGPTPKELETQKQRAVYSDCLEQDRNLTVHLPRNLNWRKIAWERLCEAQAIISNIRDYPPEELTIWHKHAENAHRNNEGFATILRPLHEELLAKDFVIEGQWSPILEDIVAEEEKD